MTADECLCLPNQAEVLLPDGRRGRIAVWHKSTGALGIVVDGTRTMLTVSCFELHKDDHGRLVFWAPAKVTAGATPRP